MTILFAAPYVPPAPVVPPSQLPGIKHTWTGWDGTVWNLSDYRSGVFLMGDVEGMAMPDITNYTHSSPVVHGVQWDDWLATGRKVNWNIGVYTDPSRKPAEWIELNRAFWRTMRPGTTGVWTIELPTGEKFSLTLRFAAVNAPLTRDPSKAGWQVYGIELLPENPFFDAGTIVGSWVVGRQIPFYGFRRFGPPFYHSPASQLATAKISNTGDVEAYLEWTIVGPSTSAVVGLDGELIRIPFPIERGQRLIIDTDPLNQIAELDGEDVMERIGFGNWNPAPLPRVRTSSWT